MSGIFSKAEFDEMIVIADKASGFSDRARLDFALSLFRAMIESGMSEADLASRSGESDERIAEVLRCDADLTIGQMMSLAVAAGGTLRVLVERIA